MSNVRYGRLEYIWQVSQDDRQNDGDACKIDKKSSGYIIIYIAHNMYTKIGIVFVRWQSDRTARGCVGRR